MTLASQPDKEAGHFYLHKTLALLWVLSYYEAVKTNLGGVVKIYVVEMLRWGDTETHHYVVGAFSTRAQAEEVGYAEECWRGGKYDKHIVEVELDSFCKEIMDYSKGSV